MIYIRLKAEHVQQLNTQKRKENIFSIYLKNKSRKFGVIFKLYFIKFSVFKDEIKRKLDIKSELLPFTLTMLSRSKLMISGVKSVMLFSDEQLKFRLTSGVVLIDGEELQIVEIGGGDVYVKGLIKEVHFE